MVARRTPCADRVQQRRSRRQPGQPGRDQVGRQRSVQRLSVQRPHLHRGPRRSSRRRAVGRLPEQAEGSAAALRPRVRRALRQRPDPSGSPSFPGNRRSVDDLATLDGPDRGVLEGQRAERRLARVWGGRRDDFSASPGFFPGRMGTTATGLVGAAGAVGLREAARGSIDHAIGLGIPEVAHWSTCSYPAQRSDGDRPLGTPHAIMEGTRFRLDPNVDVDALGLLAAGRHDRQGSADLRVHRRGRSGAVAPTIESGDAVEAATGTNPWVALLDGARPYQVMRNSPGIGSRHFPSPASPPTNQGRTTRLGRPCEGPPASVRNCAQTPESGPASRTPPSASSG